VNAEKKDNSPNRDVGTILNSPSKNLTAAVTRKSFQDSNLFGLKNDNDPSVQ